MKKIVFLIIITVLIFFWPVFLQNRLPVNGPFLVSFFSPWRFEDWAHIPAKPTSLDQLRLYYPYMGLTLESWRKLEIPLWNPYNFSGNPHMAELQSGVFYPLFLFSFLPQEIFWTLMVISSFILGALFTYLYLRSLGLGKLASYFGGLTYSFSLVNICWSQEVVTAPHAALWLPLILWAMDKFVKTTRWQYWVFLVLGGVFSVLSGYLQVTLYLFLFCFLYSLRFLRKNFFKVVLIDFGLLLSILMASFQNFPAYELYNLSARKLIDVSNLLMSYLLPIRLLITLLITDFFGHPVTANHYGVEVGSYYERAFALGAIPMIFLLFSFWEKKKRGIIIFFLTSGALALALAFDLSISRLVFTWKIPLLSTSIANRTFFFSSFAFATLAAIGLDRWLRRPEFSSFMRVFLIFTSVFLIIIFSVLHARERNLFILIFFPGWTRVALRNAVIPALASIGCFLLLFCALPKVSEGKAEIELARQGYPAALRQGSSFLTLLRKKYRFFLVGLVIILSLMQSYYSFQKYTPFSKREYIYPSAPLLQFLQEKAGIERFWGYGEAFLDNNLATQFKIFTSEGYDSLNERRYNNLLWSTNTEGILTTQTSRSDAGIRRAPDTDSFQADKRRLRMLSLLGIKYILDIEEPKFDNIGLYDEERFSGEDFQLAWQEANWRVFEYNKALPRIFLVADYKIETEEQKIVDWLYDGNLDLRKTLILEEEIPERFKLADDEDAQVTLLAYEPNKVRVETDSETDQLLFLSDTYYPGWQVKVNGEQEKIYRADFAFRAIPIKAGKQVIEFYYWPESFKKGLLVSLFASLVFVTVVVLLKFNETRKIQS